MEKTFTLILLLLSQFSFSQNLLPNASFENYTSCPTQLDQVDSVINWFSVSQSPDYFNSCSPIPQLSVPGNNFGYQPTLGGNGYCGLFCYNSAANYREYIGTQLTVPLVDSQKYFISFNLSLSGGLGFTKGCNKFGCKLSTIPFTYNSITPDNNAIFYSDSIIIDTLNWIFIKGSFTADSAYNYIAFGNFFDDANTDTFGIAQFSNHAYYYIDDVCLTIDSLLCIGPNEIKEIVKEEDFNIFPNPGYDVINIISKSSINKVEVYDYSGRLILNNFINKKTSEIEINCSNWEGGIYMIKIDDAFFKQLIIH